VRRKRWLRGLAALLASGALFQASSCTFQGNQAVADLATQIAAVLISDVVNGTFNVSGTGF